jgi:hypothetical protein
MRRAGREPAEDVKRRLIAACEEVGQAATGLMQLIGDERIVLVSTPTVELIARVPISGMWPDTIEVRCGTSANALDPWMRGRSKVPFDEIIMALRETLDERAKVIAAMRLGLEGPYHFERSVWAKPSFLD